MKDYKIVATLSKGKIFSKSEKILLNVLMYSSMMFFLICIVVAMISTTKKLENERVQLAFCGVCGAALFLCIFIILLVILIKNNKIYKQVNLWLDDGVEVNAHIKTVDKKWLSKTGYISKVVVKFKLHGKKYTRYSTNKPFSYDDGYDKIFTEFADKDMVVLYSEKYDEVLFFE